MRRYSTLAPCQSHHRLSGAVKVIEYDHVKGVVVVLLCNHGRGGFMIGAAICQTVYQPGITVICEDDWLVSGKQCIEVFI